MDNTVEQFNIVAKRNEDLVTAICNNSDEARATLTRLFGDSVTECNGDAVLALQHFAKRCMRAARFQRPSPSFI